MHIMQLWNTEYNCSAPQHPLPRYCKSRNGEERELPMKINPSIYCYSY